MRTKSKFWSRSCYVYFVGPGPIIHPFLKKNYFFESILINAFGIASKSARLDLLREGGDDNIIFTLYFMIC